MWHFPTPGSKETTMTEDERWKSKSISVWTWIVFRQEGVNLFLVSGEPTLRPSFSSSHHFFTYIMKRLGRKPMDHRRTANRRSHICVCINIKIPSNWSLFMSPCLSSTDFFPCFGCLQKSARFHEQIPTTICPFRLSYGQKWRTESKHRYIADEEPTKPIIGS